MTLEETVIERIKLRLEATGKSASAASMEAGLGRSAIQSILSGTSESPRLSTINRLTRPLECTLPYLIGSSDDPASVGDLPKATSLAELPDEMVTIQENVVSVGRGDAFAEIDPKAQFLAADDCIAVRDTRYPEVPVRLFEIYESPYPEYFPKRCIVTALTNLAEHSVAIEDGAFLITKDTRLPQKREARIELQQIFIEQQFISIGKAIFGRSEFADSFQYLVYSGNRMIVPKADLWHFDEHFDVEILGLVIRSTVLWKGRQNMVD